MAPFKQYPVKAVQQIGSLDMGEKGQNCNKINFPPIGKQLQVRVWILTATLCSVACVTIVCATIWACSIAGIGRSGAQRNEMSAHNNVLTEDMVKILWAKRHPEMDIDSATKKESFLSNFGEHFQDNNSPQNNIHGSNIGSNQSESTTKPFEDVLDDLGSKIERVDDTLTSEMERLGLLQRLNNSDKETSQEPVKNQTSISSLILKPALSVEDVFKQIPTDAGKFSQDFTRIEVQPSDVTQTELKAAAPQQELQPNILVSLIPSEFAGLSPDFNTKTYRELTEDHSEKFLPEEDGGPLDLNSYSDETYYGPDSYFYSELDAQEYYNDYEQATWTGFIVEKIQDLHDWMSSDFHTEGGNSKGNPNNTIPQILSALNWSIVKGDASILLLKLKDLYYGLGDDTRYNASQSRALLTNTTNPASFGLLTLDVMLLRNLQLMAWEDEDTAAYEVLKDPELFAMNALFLEPENVRKIYEELKEGHKKPSLYSERAADLDDTEILPLASYRAELTSSFYSTTDVGRGLMDFAFSTLRAAANLGRVFRQAKSQQSIQTEQSKCVNCSKLLEINSKANETKMEQAKSGRQPESSAVEEHSELDCVWIIYCRNLEKAANSTGIYGFLAKLNSLGLRLLIGELKVERAVDALLEDILDGPKRLNCDEIFPRCSKKNAAKIILEGIVSRTPPSSSNSSQH